VHSPELATWLTGAYKARVRIEHERQFLEFDLEFRAETPPTPAVQDLVYAALVQALGREQPEFIDDWRNIYTAWDNDRPRRILRFNPFTWPELSQRTEKEIKQRGTQK
jgi:phenylacetate-CoA ligase